MSVLGQLQQYPKCIFGVYDVLLPNYIWSGSLAFSAFTYLTVHLVWLQNAGGCTIRGPLSVQVKEIT